MGWGSINFPKIDWPRLDLKKAANINMDEVFDKNGSKFKSVGSDIKAAFPTEEIGETFSSFAISGTEGFSGVGDKVSDMIHETGLDTKFGGKLNVKKKISDTEISASDLPTSTDEIIPFLKKVKIPGVTDTLNSIPDVESMMNSSSSVKMPDFDISGSNMTKELGIDNIDVGDSGFDINEVNLDDIDIGDSGKIEDMLKLKSGGVGVKSPKLNDLSDLNFDTPKSVMGTPSTDDILGMYSDIGLDPSGIPVGKPSTDLNDVLQHDKNGELNDAKEVLDTKFNKSVVLDVIHNKKSINDALPASLTKLDSQGIPQLNTVDIDPSIIEENAKRKPKPYKGPSDVPKNVYDDVYKSDPTEFMKNPGDTISNLVTDALSGNTTPSSYISYLIKEHLPMVKKIKLGTNEADREAFKQLDQNMLSSSMDHKAMLNSESTDAFTRSQRESNNTMALFSQENSYKKTSNFMLDNGVSAEEMFKGDIGQKNQQKGLQVLNQISNDSEYTKSKVQKFNFYDATKKFRFNNPEIGWEYGKHTSLTLIGNKGFEFDDTRITTLSESIKSQDFKPTAAHEFRDKVKSGVSGFFTGFVHDSIEGRDKSHDAMLGAITLGVAGGGLFLLNKKYNLFSGIKGSTKAVKDLLNMKFGEGVIDDSVYDKETGELLKYTKWVNGETKTIYSKKYWDTLKPAPDEREKTMKELERLRGKIEVSDKLVNTNYIENTLIKWRVWE